MAIHFHLHSPADATLKLLGKEFKTLGAAIGEFYDLTRELPDNTTIDLLYTRVNSPAGAWRC